MYDTMRKNFFWLHMAKDVYQTLSSCATCSCSQQRARLKQHLQFYFVSTGLKVIAEMSLAHCRKQRMKAYHHKDNGPILGDGKRDPYLKDDGYACSVFVPGSLPRSKQYT